MKNHLQAIKDFLNLLRDFCHGYHFTDFRIEDKKKNEPCCFHWPAYSYVSFILFEILVSISVVLSEIQ